MRYITNDTFYGILASNDSKYVAIMLDTVKLTDFQFYELCQWAKTHK